MAVKRFISYYKPHKKLFFADLAAAFFLALCDLVFPMITRKMVNEFIPGKLVGELLMWAGIMLGIYLLKLALNFFVTYYGHMV